MWTSVKTPALILTSQPWREADRRYTALTPGVGKITFLGRGARKGKAKLAPHLEPFGLLELELIRGMRGFTVIGVERSQAFSKTREEWSTRSLALAVTSFLDAVLREEEFDERFFNLLSGVWAFLESSPSLSDARARFIFAGVIAKTLDHLGYALRLEACVNCRERILPLSFRWNDAHGGLVCTDCVLKASHEWSSSRMIPEEAVTLLRFLHASSFSDLLRPKLVMAELDEAIACLERMMGYHIPGLDGQKMHDFLLLESLPPVTVS